jgi:NAD(P)H-flavin reductase
VGTARYVPPVTHPPYPLRVLQKEEIAPKKVLVRLGDAPAEMLQKHTAPGQYALMGWALDALYPIALVSVPGDSPLEVLIGPYTDEERDVLMAREGPLFASDPQGPGFPLEPARGKRLLLVAGGSAIGPLRAVVEAILRDRESFGPVALFFGARRSEDFCFSERFAAWRAGGIDLTLVASQDERWTGPRGYVQEHLPAALADPDDTLAYVCGRPEMEEQVKAALVARGLSPSRVRKNWP